jgi:hypothetical protein
MTQSQHVDDDDDGLGTNGNTTEASNEAMLPSCVSKTDNNGNPLSSVSDTSRN